MSNFANEKTNVITDKLQKSSLNPLSSTFYFLVTNISKINLRLLHDIDCFLFYFEERVMFAFDQQKLKM